MRPSLTLIQKVGQLFFIGIPGPELDEPARKLLTDISPGGICLFARNIKESKQTRELLDSIRELLPIEPFLSLDQEGGLVDRLRRIMTPMPAAGSLKTSEQAARLGGIIGEAIRILGFNMDFAPVVDVIDEARSKFQNGLYSRTFGSSAEEVVHFASAFIEELERTGCIGCLKHFPGLGASEVDSHEELPVVNISTEEMSSVDLYPYKQLLDSRRAVMLAHAAYPMLALQETDKNGKLIPSSLSRMIVTQLLRDDLGFDGIVLTDDLEMGAIVKNYGIGKACKMAVNAGQDMLAICASLDAIMEGFEAVLNAVEIGEITEDRLDESLNRIQTLKKTISPPPIFDSDRLRGLSGEIDKLM